MQTRCPQCGTVFRVQSEQLAMARGLVRCGICQTVFDARARRVADPPQARVSSARAVPFNALPSPRRTRTTVWFLLNLSLLLLLAGQYVYRHREELAAQPVLRPGMELFCAAIRCDLPPWRDLSALEITSRQVQSHPVLAGTLLIDVTFVNRAARAQPYPDLVLTFRDTEERPIASRRFTPAEYLPRVPNGLLDPGSEAHAILEILDPGDRAFGYEFAFR